MMMSLLNCSRLPMFIYAFRDLECFEPFLKLPSALLQLISSWRLYSIGFCLPLLLFDLPTGCLSSGENRFFSRSFSIIDNGHLSDSFWIVTNGYRFLMDSLDRSICVQQLNRLMDKSNLQVDKNRKSG